MDLCSKKAVKFWLKKYGLQPSKRWGQNFLIDKSVLKKIIEAAFPSAPPPLGGGAEDVVLEIGPGIGTLTRELIQRAKNVIAVEKDAKMVEILKETLKDYKNIKIIHDDILKTDLKNYKLPSLDSPAASPRGEPLKRGGQTINYKLISNLPYNVATAVIRKFLETENPPTEMVLMVQKEVAQRITTKPPRMNLLAVSVQFYAEPKIISYVSKKSFWPMPKVDSAIIKIKPSSPETRSRAAARDRVSGTKNSDAKDLFFKVVKAGFSQPRKQLINNLTRLRQGYGGQRKEKIRVWLLKNNIQPSQRAETLNVNDWINLTKSF